MNEIKDKRLTIMQIRNSDVYEIEHTVLQTTDGAGVREACKQCQDELDAIDKRVEQINKAMEDFPKKVKKDLEEAEKAKPILVARIEKFKAIIDKMPKPEPTEAEKLKEQFKTIG
jgi:hypothetical protein